MFVDPPFLGLGAERPAHLGTAPVAIPQTPHPAGLFPMLSPPCSVVSESMTGSGCGCCSESCENHANDARDCECQAEPLELCKGADPIDNMFESGSGPRISASQGEAVDSAMYWGPIVGVPNGAFAHSHIMLQQLAAGAPRAADMVSPAAVFGQAMVIKTEREDEAESASSCSLESTLSSTSTPSANATDQLDTPTTFQTCADTLKAAKSLLGDTDGAQALDADHFAELQQLLVKSRHNSLEDSSFLEGYLARRRQAASHKKRPVTTPEEVEKRRRNNLASARFRAKKKMREQLLERLCRDLISQNQALAEQARQIEAEAQILRGLVPPEAVAAAQASASAAEDIVESGQPV